MIHPDAKLGFRVVGGVNEPRRLTDAAAAFAAHCAASAKAETDRECYLSAFCFGQDFRDHLAATGSAAGFAGACWSPWLWVDLDRPDPAVALADARRLAGFLLHRHTSLEEDDLLYFFSGKKGFHFGLPLAHTPSPAVAFPRVCRQFAEQLGREAGVAIDSAVYDRPRLFRAPNSRHPASGLHKRRLTHDELMGLPVERVMSLAREPHGFEVPFPSRPDDTLTADWATAEAAVVAKPPPGAAVGASRVHRATHEFLWDGAADGERHNRLFAAAANLAELGVPHAAVAALVAEGARISGLSPSETARTIGNAVAHVQRKGVAGGD